MTRFYVRKDEEVWLWRHEVTLERSFATEREAEDYLSSICQRSGDLWHRKEDKTMLFYRLEERETCPQFATEYWGPSY